MYLQDEFSLVKVTSYGFNQHLIQYLASSIINSPIRTSCRADLEAQTVGSNKWIVTPNAFQIQPLGLPLFRVE